ncbi:hypothetical protein [Paraclostridium sordellii]|uniref:hypothetical protein n=1 Tax=Paraclostridium sordellii TaxID=1505 RepID=UPI0005E42BE7|nr:hypothetical protein [Paeniclostridium sordellii]CEO20930.1 Uncharacterised protein [[Clostridium] sordellii] [Paeniclostridium sordellii]
MKTLKSSKIIINNNDILNNDVINLNIYIEKLKYNLVEGTIYNPNNKAIKNACIEIIEVNKKTTEQISIGYCFTNEYGKYGYTLSFNENSYYLFNVYSPL